MKEFLQTRRNGRNRRNGLLFLKSSREYFLRSWSKPGRKFLEKAHSKAVVVAVVVVVVAAVVVAAAVAVVAAVVVAAGEDEG